MNSIGIALMRIYILPRRQMTSAGLTSADATSLSATSPVVLAIFAVGGAVFFSWFCLSTSNDFPSDAAGRDG